MSKRPEVILLKETPLRSWTRDMSSVAGFVLLIGIGVYLQSNAMQWVGAILGFLTIIGKAAQLGKDNRVTIEQALLEEEKTVIQADIKEVYYEAKGVGFDTKAIRSIIKLRKKDQAERQEEEAVLDLYKSAIGLV